MAGKEEFRPLRELADGATEKLPQLNVTITLGTEATNDIDITIQLYDWEDEVTERYLLEYWFADTVGGAVSACSGSGSPSVGTEMEEVTNHGHYRTLTDATGEIVHMFQQTGDATKYLHVRLPGSGQIVTQAVVWAA